MGNLWPILPALPLFGFAVYSSLQLQNWFVIENLALLGLGCFVLVVSTNYLALAGNAKLKTAIWRRFASDGQSPSDLGYFVGIATPGFVSILDPHQDIGFLQLQPNRLLFRGDSIKLEIEKINVRSISRAANPHSLLFLGGWVVVEGVINGKPIQLMIEPRDGATLRQNRGRLSALQADLQQWLKAK